MRRQRAARDHLSDWLRVRGRALEVSDRLLGFCSFFQTAILSLIKVGALRLFGCIRFRALWGIYPVLLGVLWGFDALLLGCFVTIQVLVLLEGQQVRLLLLQLSLELLGLALLLKLPPFILLSAGREVENSDREMVAEVVNTFIL